MRSKRRRSGGMAFSGMVMLGILAAGCAESKRAAEPARAAPQVQPVSQVQASPGEMKVQCTVTPEQPDGVRLGQLATIRSAHTWSIRNDTDQARPFVVVLEITDNLGHAKKKEVPGEVKARSSLEDSTSIALVTTYREAGPVEAQAKTSVRMNDKEVATRSEAYRFTVDPPQ